MKDITANSISVAYDGSSSAAVTSATITGLVLNQNYEFWVTALNPLESDTSNSTILTAAALPTAPGAISVVTRTSDTLQLSWVATSNDGGSPVLAYTLVEDTFDDQSGEINTRIMYFGIATSTIIKGLISGSQYTFRVLVLT